MRLRCLYITIRVGDCGDKQPGSNFSWKSQVDEVLYGTDIDQSGDLGAMHKALSTAPQFKGAAGVTSLEHAHDAPEHRMDVNTRIHTTYGIDAGVPAPGHKPGTPVREPIKQIRNVNPHQHPELFSKAGLRGWMNKERPAEGGRHAGPGKDEAWRPWHNQGKFFYSA